MVQSDIAKTAEKTRWQVLSTEYRVPSTEFRNPIAAHSQALV